MEATGRMPQQETRLISPTLPVTSQGSRRCLTVKVNAHGQHLGKFIVRDEKGNRLYSEQNGSTISNAIFHYMSTLLCLDAS